MKGAKIKVKSYRPVSLASVVCKFARRLKGSSRLSSSNWFHGRVFLPTKNLLDTMSPELGSL